MRLSDILKKTSNQPAAQQATTPQPEAPKAEVIAQKPQISPNAPAQTPVPVNESLSPSLKADQVYTKAIIEIKNIITSLGNNIPYTSNLECVSAIAELIEENNEDILILADKATPDIFLYGHCVNLCIFSIFLGKGFSLPNEKLIELGYCALLCDIGLTDSASPAKHPALNSQEAVKLISNLSLSAATIVTSVISQKQTLKNGQALPESKGTDIYDFTRIIAVADVYETLTHPRANKERILPHEALKALISGANQNFDSDIIKLFIDRLSLYPPGSFVKLNSDEIGRIIGINRGLPTRPKVKVFIDNEKRKMAEARIVDLSTNPMLFVKEAVDETKINTPDKKLMLELKAMRWWVKGL